MDPNKIIKDTERMLAHFKEHSIVQPFELSILHDLLNYAKSTVPSEPVKEEPVIIAVGTAKKYIYGQKGYFKSGGDKGATIYADHSRYFIKLIPEPDNKVQKELLIPFTKEDLYQHIEFF